jgi:hypothetical protein
MIFVDDTGSDPKGTPLPLLLLPGIGIDIAPTVDAGEIAAVWPLI